MTTTLPTPTAPDDEKYFVTSEFSDAPEAVVKQLLKKLHAQEKRKKAAEEGYKAAQQAIIDIMGGSEILRIEETGQEVVTHKVVTAMVVDTVRLKKDHAGLVAQYQKPRTSRPFRDLT